MAGSITLKEALDNAQEFGRRFTQGVQQAVPLLFGAMQFREAVEIFQRLGLDFAIKLVFQVAQQYAMKQLQRPTLAMQERHISFFSSVTGAITGLRDRILGRKPEKSPPFPIFSEDINRQVKDFIQGIATTRKEGGYFQNILFYGPPGVGKTMICERIALEAGVNFIIMSGVELPQHIRLGEHVSMLNQIFNRIDSSSEPTVLVIDEAEVLCLDRSHHRGWEFHELLSAFLQRTGSPSKKLILCLATNTPELLDKAVLSRMDKKLFIGLPSLEERKEMFRAYVFHFFEDKQNHLFTEEKLRALAAKTEGVGGRAICKILNAIFLKQAGENSPLTHSIIDQMVEDFMTQEKGIVSTT